LHLVAGAARRAGVAPNKVRDIKHAVNIIWIALAVVGILKVLGVTSEFTTLTVSGIAGLAASLALQSTLQNIISGFSMLRDHTLRLNDQIEYGGVTGQVTRMEFRSTWLKNEKGSSVIVSNSSLQSGPLTNHTATKRLEKKLTVRA
jgi:small conductance mechanosensitive channel